MSLSALNESGAPTDWWFIYKVPKLTQSAKNDSATGFEYAYFDDKAKKVDRSKTTLDKHDGALARTLQSVFNSNSKTAGWILYNDELPPGADKGTDNHNLGHTKGMLGFDTASGTGFWLIHSWPKYTAPHLAGAPAPQYGQTFLCLSLSIDTIREIAKVMPHHHQPQCYLPQAANLKKGDPIFDLTRDPPSHDQPSTAVLDLQTVGKMPFKLIAKNREWNKDFWNGLVGPTLKEDMDVETWIRGQVPPVADTDGIHKTFDIKYINLGPLGIHFAWPESHDHAKWGITVNGDWICVGDINRMVSQRKRGGGCVAIQNRILWQALSKTNLVLAPPNHTRDEALDLIHSTHTPKAL